ncbi:MAG: FeoB-associated Cys-rich membrane protein [Clostridia bacterium]|nr:FeoB-associated Cys-rich membrane protein [Clostridia bacterium]
MDYLGTIVVAIIVFSLVLSVVIYMIKQHKNQKNSCCGGCAGCPMANSCHKYDETEKNKASNNKKK